MSTIPGKVTLDELQDAIGETPAIHIDSDIVIQCVNRDGSNGKRFELGAVEVLSLRGNQTVSIFLREAE